MNEKKIKFQAPSLLKILGYDQASYHLIELFYSFRNNDLSELSSNLKKDIETCMLTIAQIELFDSNRKPYYEKDQNYKSYLQSNIKKLNIIMKKSPIKVGIDFIDYGDLFWNIRRYKEDDMQKEMEVIQNKIDALSAKKSLSRMRFYPFVGIKAVTSIVKNGEQEQGMRPEDIEKYAMTLDEMIQEFLSAGIFDYLQKLMLGLPRRPRVCINCANWFLSARSSNKFCSAKCKDTFYGKSEKGKKTRAKASRRYRKKKKESST